MTTTLILLKDGRNILVSDEKIVGGIDYYFDLAEYMGKLENPNNPHFEYIVKPHKDFNEKKSYRHKIIAGIEPLPTLTYSDEVKQHLRDKYGWVDVDELIKECIKNEGLGDYWANGDNDMVRRVGKSVIKAHQSITNKMFSLEKAELIFGLGAANNANGKPSFEEVIQSLQQPIQLNVEIDKKEKCRRCYSTDKNECWSAKECSDGKYDLIEPKITNNSILITKILN